METKHWASWLRAWLSHGLTRDTTRGRCSTWCWGRWRRRGLVIFGALAIECEDTSGVILHVSGNEAGVERGEYLNFLLEVSLFFIFVCLVEALGDNVAVDGKVVEYAFEDRHDLVHIARLLHRLLTRLDINR